MKLSEFKKYKILSIDTSCDETSVSITYGFNVISNVYASQVSLHRVYGGVVPSIAKLAHAEKIDSVLKLALSQAKFEYKDIDLFAVTYGPGLAIALEVGIRKAKELSIQYKKPLLAINHMEGHLFSSLAKRSTDDSDTEINFPILGFLISGGHTEILQVESFNKITKIGETLDDAAGECLDKCGRLLNLGYPAGPAITKICKENRANFEFGCENINASTQAWAQNKLTLEKIELPIPMARSNNLDFSFSGLKTAFSSLISQTNVTPNNLAHLCLALEHTVISALKIKLLKTEESFQFKEVWLGGGVVNSAYLKQKLRVAVPNKQVRVPFTSKLNGDNAAMIGIAANIKLNQFKLNLKEESIENKLYINNFDGLDRSPNLSF